MHNFYHILNLPGTLTVVTAGVSLIAVYLYQKQKNDRRKEAASIVLAEVTRAEDMLPEARKSLIATKKVASNAARVQVMTTNSWQTSQHLLSRFLPDDVSRSISDFYANCMLLDELLAYIYTAFRENVAEVRVNQFRISADYLKEKIDCVKPNPDNNQTITESNTAAVAVIEARMDEFTKKFPTTTAYYPSKPTDDAQIYLDLLKNNLSQTRVGDKLRQIQKGAISSRLGGRDK